MGVPGDSSGLCLRVLNQGCLGNSIPSKEDREIYYLGWQAARGFGAFARNDDYVNLDFQSLIKRPYQPVRVRVLVNTLRQLSPSRSGCPFLRLH